MSVLNFGIGLFVQIGNCGSNRHAGQNGFDMRRGIFGIAETLGNQRGIFAEKAVGAAHNRILFVDNQVYSEQNGCHGTGKRGVAAETDDTGRFAGE